MVIKNIYINGKKYSLAFNHSIIFGCLIVLLIAILFKGYLKPFVDTYIYEQSFHKIWEYIPQNMILACFLFGGFAYFLHRIINGLYPTINSSLVFISAMIIYLLYVHCNPNYSFRSFEHWELPFIKYIDTIFLVLTFLLITYDPLTKKELDPSYRNFDWQQYATSFSTKKILKYILAAFLILYLKAIIQPKLEGFVYENFSYLLTQNFVSNILFSVLPIYVLINISPKIEKGLAPSINSICISILTLIIYLYYGRASSTYTLHSFEEWGLPLIKYTDVLFLSTMLLILNFRAYNKQLNKGDSNVFVEDSPDNVDEGEDHNYTGYAGILASKINSSTTKDQSFSIGIYAYWGTGKTYFLKNLEKQLKKDEEDENIIIHFNAWRANSPEILIEDFFATLSKGLKPYNASISNKIIGYSKKLFQPAKEIHFRLIDTLLNEIVGPESINERYDTINTAIKRTGKRFIIFIDDLDRLTGTEIISVLKIIRNTANFANTFFIVALDHDYVVDAVRKTDSFAKEDQYLKKIFQLIVTLPKIQKKFFQFDIKHYLTYKKMDYLDKSIIDDALKRITLYDNNANGDTNFEGLLESMLDNMRDLKRFVNIIKLNFSTLKNEILLADYFLLVLLQIKQFDLYQLISDRSLLKGTSDNTDFYTFDENKWIDYINYKRDNNEPIQAKNLERVLNSLLNSP